MELDVEYFVAVELLSLEFDAELLFEREVEFPSEPRLFELSDEPLLELNVHAREIVFVGDFGIQHVLELVHVYGVGLVRFGPRPRVGAGDVFRHHSVQGIIVRIHERHLSRAVVSIRFSYQVEIGGKLFQRIAYCQTRGGIGRGCC